jgi:hypothetical protein
MFSFKIKIVVWWMRFLGIIFSILVIGKLLGKEFDIWFFICLLSAFLLFLFSKFLLKKKVWAYLASLLLLSPSLLIVMLILFGVNFCVFFEILAKLTSARAQISCDFSEFLIPLIPSLFIFIPLLLLILARREFFERPIIISEKIRNILINSGSIMSFIIELLFSAMLFLGAKVAFDVYQELKSGAGSLTFLEFGGNPLFWTRVLIILGVIILVIGINCLKKKRWAYIGSLIIAPIFPTLVSFVLGPPLAPAAAPLFFFVFLGISFISFIWIILLLLIIWVMKENKNVQYDKSN